MYKPKHTTCLKSVTAGCLGTKPFRFTEYILVLLALKTDNYAHTVDHYFVLILHTKS